jgi:phosphohistidine phosphatase
MKTLLLLRHGKAQADAPHGDKKRALTDRGTRDSKTIGSVISSLVTRIDAVITSDAKRADETAELAAASAGYSGKITYEPAMYGADLDTLIRVVRHLPDSADRVLLVGHNPGFEELAAALPVEGTSPPRLPTAGVAHIEFDATHWRDVRPGTGRLVGVHTPKEGSK